MAVIDAIKEVANTVKDIGDIDLNRQIIDLQSEVFELIEENYKLKSEIRDLKDLADTQNKLVFKNNKYYLNINGSKEGPYCSPCWDYDNKLVRLHENSLEMFLCPICIKKN